MTQEYKNYNLESDGTFGMIYVKPKGKGSVPLQLRGAYTSLRHAQVAIDSVESDKESAEDAKTVRRSRT